MQWLIIPLIETISLYKPLAKKLRATLGNIGRTPIPNR
jgi:hypothetical protein